MEQSARKLQAVMHYVDSFRDMVNDCVSGKGDPARRLKLPSDDDWSFVCVAMDILGDASMAIGNVLDFSLDGPTKYSNTGEKYLRLYGLLGALYSQQRAALKLHNLTNCREVAEFRARARELQSAVLRHQLVAHSLDLLEEGKVTSAYVPIRIDLGGFNCTVTRNRGDGSTSYDLLQVVAEHCDFMSDILDTVYEKSLATFFKTDQGRQEKHREKLAELRGIRAGQIFLVAGSTRILISSVEEK